MLLQLALQLLLLLYKSSSLQLRKSRLSFRYYLASKAWKRAQDVFHAICMQSCPSTGMIHTMHHASPESLLCSTSVGTVAQYPGWADTCMHIVAFVCCACCKGAAVACIPDAGLHLFKHHGSLKLSLLCCSSCKPAAYISVLVMPSFRHAFTLSVSSSCIAAYCHANAVVCLKSTSVCEFSMCCSSDQAAIHRHAS